MIHSPASETSQAPTTYRHKHLETFSAASVGPMRRITQPNPMTLTARKVPQDHDRSTTSRPKLCQHGYKNRRYIHEHDAPSATVSSTANGNTLHDTKDRVENLTLVRRFQGHARAWHETPPLYQVVVQQSSPSSTELKPRQTKVHSKNLTGITQRRQLTLCILPTRYTHHTGHSKIWVPRGGSLQPSTACAVALPQACMLSPKQHSSDKTSRSVPIDIPSPVPLRLLTREWHHAEVHNGASSPCGHNAT